MNGDPLLRKDAVFAAPLRLRPVQPEVTQHLLVAGR